MVILNNTYYRLPEKQVSIVRRSSIVFEMTSVYSV